MKDDNSKPRQEKKPPVFQIEQIAIRPTNQQALILLSALGLNNWIKDEVAAVGTVYGAPAENKALLQFNYDAGPVKDKPLEVEILQYMEGPNWLAGIPGNVVSHIGMHVTPEELIEWRERMAQIGVAPVQEVNTVQHTNPSIKDERRYNYVIYGTRALIGFDVKFIVRIDINQEGSMPDESDEDSQPRH